MQKLKSVPARGTANHDLNFALWDQQSFTILGCSDCHKYNGNFC